MYGRFSQSCFRVEPAFAYYLAENITSTVAKSDPQITSYTWHQTIGAQLDIVRVRLK